MTRLVAANDDFDDVEVYRTKAVLWMPDTPPKIVTVAFVGDDIARWFVSRALPRRRRKSQVAAA